MEQYERIQVLGRGSYGLAVLVRERGGGRRGHLQVIKEIDLIRMSASAQNEAQAEAGVLKSLSHINIIAHYITFIESSKLHIVMEYADGGDLAQSIRLRRKEGGCFAQDEALSIFMQCCLALQHVHSHHVLHRDLKCQNIFLTKAAVVKLGDFGIAKVLENTAGKAMTMIGTPGYLSPEVVDNKPYGIQADIWSLGVVLYEVLVLESPFQGNCLAALVLKIVTAEPKPVPSQHYSEEVRRMVTWCLKKSPEQRPSTEDLLALPTLRHGIGLLPSVVVEYIRAGPPFRPPAIASEGLDVTRLPPGRSPVSQLGRGGCREAPSQEPPSVHAPAVHKPRRRSKVQPVLGILSEDVTGQEPPLQRRGGPTAADHRRTPSGSRNATRAPTPEASNALWHGLGGGGPNFAGGDAVDEFLLNKHAGVKLRPRAGPGLDGASPGDRPIHGAAGLQRAPPRSGLQRVTPDASPLKDLADFFPNLEPARATPGCGDGDSHARMWSPDILVGNAVSNTPRSAAGACSELGPRPGRRHTCDTKMTNEATKPSKTDAPLVGLAVGPNPVPLCLRMSPRAAQFNGHNKITCQDEFASFSEIALPATPIGMPRESPRVPLGFAEGRRDSSRKPRSSIGVVGAGMVAGRSAAMGQRSFVDDVSGQAASNNIEEHNSMKPCQSPVVPQPPGFSGNELADISNLFGDTFARELLDPANRAELNASADLQADTDDSLVNELARLCTSPREEWPAENCGSRHGSHSDFVEDEDDALSDSWYAAKALTQELEITMTAAPLASY